MPKVKGVNFELERFRWGEDDRLEIVGRWHGLRGRRLETPMLTVEAASGPRRLSALPGGQLTGAAGETWRAAFVWDGAPEEIASAEREVGRLVVELPPPRRRRRARPAEASAPAGARDAEVQALRDEMAAARERLEALRADHEELSGRHRELEDRHAALLSGAGELRGALNEAGEAEERLAAELAAAHAERELLAGESEALRAELEARRAEVERTRTEAERPAADLERERERVGQLRAELEALRAEGERARRAEAASGANGLATTEESPEARPSTQGDALEGLRGPARGDALEGPRGPARGDPVEVARGPARGDASPPATVARSRVPPQVERSPAWRIEAARAAAAHRVPEAHLTPARMWAARAVAFALVVGLLFALLLILL